MSEVPPGLTTGQILDRVFRLTRAYWRLFAGIALVPAAAIMVPTYGLMAWMVIELWPQIFARSGAQPHFPLYFSILFIAAGNLLPIPVFALYVPAGAYAALQANLGVKVTFRQAYSVAWRHYGRYLWLMVLVFLYIAGPLVVFGVLIGGGALLIAHFSQPGAAPAALFLLAPAAILGYFGFLVYCILFMLRFAVAYPAAVVEGLSARAALRRSTTLTCGARGRIFVVMLVVYAAMYAASMAVIMVFGIIASLGAVAAMAAHVAVGSAAFYALIGLAALLYLLFMILYASITYLCRDECGSGSDLSRPALAQGRRCALALPA
jgi:hypothetical protein